MIVQFAMSFLIPVLFSLLLTPVVIRLAMLVGAVDQPNERKVHRHLMPRLGGVAVCVSFLLSVALLFFLKPDLPVFAPDLRHKGMMLIASLLLVLILGIWDDIRTLNPGQKFIVQIFAATIAYFAGFRIASITDPFSTGLFNIGVIDYPVTVLWIVGVTNAFNLIDGLDGLASGIALIAFCTIGAVSALRGDVVTAVMVLIFAGAILGFLRYNFNPARIFLGDSGSLFIGFTLAILSIQSSTKGSTAFAILVPVLALGLPIMDTLLSMTRRLLRSLLPENVNSESWLRKLRGMFLPDRQHIHHQLIARGLTHRNVVLLLYLVSCAFGLGAFAITISTNVGASLVLIAVAIATIVGVRQLRYREMAILRNGVLLPLYEWPAMNRTLLKGFFDLGCIGLAFTAAYFLALRGEMTAQAEQHFLAILPGVCGVQLGMFCLSGLYKGTFKYLGIGDLLRVVKTVVFAVAATVGLFALQPQAWAEFTVTMVVLDFYLLLSLVAGARISFHVLNHLFRCEPRGGERVLIYGADAKGILTLQQILNDNTLNLSPIGFLDETPELEGKRVNGFPVYGGHWKLPRLVKKHKVEQILISAETIKPEVLNRLNQAADQYGIVIRRSKVLLEDITRSHLLQDTWMFEETEPALAQS
ncbi:MAG: hypothetical protein HY710_15515 [Candidatus Latescibacteria bacterium]|nr:hypothetical protein [Candidatus Latescibacterota bacterium]